LSHNPRRTSATRSLSSAAVDAVDIGVSG
jgi:hypothetical protein